jgi:hypothetical protein
MVEENLKLINQKTIKSEILDELNTLSGLLTDLSDQMRSDQRVLRDTYQVTAKAA